VDCTGDGFVMEMLEFFMMLPLFLIIDASKNHDHKLTLLILQLILLSLLPLLLLPLLPC